jgi:hypothetical protein
MRDHVAVREESPATIVVGLHQANAQGQGRSAHREPRREQRRRCRRLNLAAGDHVSLASDRCDGCAEATVLCGVGRMVGRDFGTLAERHATMAAKRERA